MSAPAVQPDPREHARSQPIAPYPGQVVIRGPRARNTLGIVSLACAMSAFSCAVAAFVLPAAGTLPLAPIGSIPAVVIGIISLARKDRPRWPAVTGLVLGAVVLVATLLVVGIALMALAQWQD
jgi:hypothetical protein